MELKMGFRLSSYSVAGIDANNLRTISIARPKSQPWQHFASPSTSIGHNFQWMRMQVKGAKKAVRKGKKKYPSERRKQRDDATDIKMENRDHGYWRFLKVPVPLQKDPGKDYVAVSDALMEAISRYLKFPVATMLPQQAFSVVRKSFDARKGILVVTMLFWGKGGCMLVVLKINFQANAMKFEHDGCQYFLVGYKGLQIVSMVSYIQLKCLKEPNFVYTVDMDVEELLKLQPRLWDFVSHLSSKPGQLEYIPNQRSPLDIISLLHNCKTGSMAPLNPEEMLKEAAEQSLNKKYVKKSNRTSNASIPRVAVVGSGPAGLFASLVLAELGAKVTLIERGQPVERRGRDIGALIVRRQLHCESNLCFGEGGAGTWSDGKLTTKIGKNSDNVQTVLQTLVHFGAPACILIDGKPHLGTDRLIHILRNFRHHLLDLGVQIMFETRMDNLLVEKKRVVGVQVSHAGGDSSINAQKLAFDAVVLAVGHSARDVYQKLVEQRVLLIPKDFAVGFRIEHPQDLINKIQYSKFADEVQKGRGKVPVADYKLATYLNEDDAQLPWNVEQKSHSCYSFCMCPGGQVVLTSTNPSELCINGMSFSKRSSKWANAAIVVTVSSKDFNDFQSHGPLAGVEFQRELEKEAAIMGGGNYVVPVQTAPDFLENKLSGVSLPSSSYRLGVKAECLHQLFPSHITHALQQSLIMFDEEIPGFISRDALLHGVETRTSAPVRIPRDTISYESVSLHGLYPVGEGAGYAGGIVSAALDGLCAALALAKQLNLYKSDLLESFLENSQRDIGKAMY